MTFSTDNEKETLQNYISGALIWGVLFVFIFYSLVECDHDTCLKIILVVHLIMYIYFPHSISSIIFNINIILKMIKMRMLILEVTHRVDGPQGVQRDMLCSYGPNPSQDSDLAFNSTPLLQARGPGLQPWPLTSDQFSLGSTPTEGWARGQWEGSAGGQHADAQLRNQRYGLHNLLYRLD